VAEAVAPARAGDGVDPGQAGQFLDFIQGDPLEDMFEVIAATGMRRGEACGLPWTEVTLGDKPVIEVAATRLYIGGEVTDDTVKSDAGNRILALDTGTATRLQRLRKRLTTCAWKRAAPGLRPGSCSSRRTAPRSTRTM
jgi:integrase